MEFKRLSVQNDSGAEIMHFESVRCWISPEENYAVAEVTCQRFLIGSILENSPEHCTIRLLERYACPFFDEDDCVFFSADVHWSYMKYGYFKIVSTNMESRHTSAHRYYCDRALYEQQRQLLHP